MEVELKAMETNNTWSIVSLPVDKNTVRCQWIYKIKYKANGTLLNATKRDLLQNDIHKKKVLITLKLSHW